MNAEDTARLKELTIRVYSKYAVKCLNKETDLVFNSYEIEKKGNREVKAVRMLKDAGIIRKVTGIDELYEIVNIEDARQYEKKPLHTDRWWNLKKDVEEAEAFLTYMAIDYQYIEAFTESEKIYIYFHQNEFDVKLRNKTPYYYRKDLVERRDKFVLKCIVEQEIKYNLPKYIQLHAGTEPEIVREASNETFKFDKYCISTVIEQNELDAIFESYTKNYNKIQAYQKSLDKFMQWVDNVGGFEEAVRIIRKGIIEDLRKDFVRFTESFRYEDRPWNDLEDALSYIKRVKELFTYDILYSEGEMDGEVFNRDTDINMEAEFDEPKQEEDKEAA